jgi:hypothetical protein
MEIKKNFYSLYGKSLVLCLQPKLFMKDIFLSILFCGIAAFGHAQSAEKAIKAYYSGWEKKDWNMVASQLADGFTFTSPNGDDHITISKFKERCWGQAQHIKEVEFEKIIADGNSALIVYNIHTTDNKTIRNAEYYTFSDGKIKSVECFFGGTGAGYPTNAK